MWLHAFLPYLLERAININLYNTFKNNVTYLPHRIVNLNGDTILQGNRNSNDNV